MEFDFSKTYYKITNKKEIHNGYQYHDGLNEDPNKWNTEACSAGGFYFTDIENIFEWIEYGDIIGYYVREVTVPEDAWVSIEKNKFKANKIILGKRMNLWDLDTIKYLVEQGANIHVWDECALRCASMNGHLEVVKYLVEQGADIHVDDDCALRWASVYGHLEVVKYLVEQGADIHVCDDIIIRFACKYGNLEVVKYLVEQGADIHTDNECALRCASANGHLDTVKYHVEQGANMHTDGELALRLASKNDHPEIVVYLKSLG